jgi:hypothetical protein
VKGLQKTEFAKWTYFLSHIKFRDTIDNTITRRVVATKREIKMTIYRALKKTHNNPHIALRTN